MLEYLLEDEELVLELDGNQGGEHEVLDREGKQTRGSLMRAREHESGMGSFLDYHVSCVRLLGKCCLGNHLKNQQKVRHLFPLEVAPHFFISSCSYFFSFSFITPEQKKSTR